MRARVDGLTVRGRALETARRGREGGRNQPGVAGAIMVITREHVHYGAAVSTREACLGAARFRLGSLLPLAYFASPSVDGTINRARTVRSRAGCGSTTGFLGIGHARRDAYGELHEDYTRTF